jgi:hypothetical protein
LKVVSSTLLCIDEDISIYGDWDSSIGGQLLLQLERCDDSVEGNTCVSEEERREWLKKQFFYFLSNE